ESREHSAPPLGRRPIPTDSIANDSPVARGYTPRGQGGPRLGARLDGFAAFLCDLECTAAAGRVAHRCTLAFGGIDVGLGGPGLRSGSAGLCLAGLAVERYRRARRVRSGARPGFPDLEAGTDAAAPLAGLGQNRSREIKPAVRSCRPTAIASAPQASLPARRW